MSEETVQLNCSSEGGPNNQFKWFKDGSEITFNGKFSINDGGNHLSSLYVNNIEGGDQGEYECLVNNTAGSSRAMTLLTGLCVCVCLQRKQLFSKAQSVLAIVK